jgi:hypothetical protein
MKISETQIYRILVPKFIRKRIVARVLRKKVLDYYANNSQLVSADVKKVLNYLQNRPIAMLPYNFQDHYIESDVDVYNDPEKGLKYVLTDGKRLYFKKRWSIRRIQKCFNELRKEQDPQSPHCYEDTTFRFEKGEILADIGAAEGNFALSVVEKAHKIILFESDKEWIEPLNATFSPWKDKVTIVQKFVGNVDNSKCTTLDSYFAPEEKFTFLKIDIEGAESLLFEGSKRILSQQQPLKIVVCTYHKPQDEFEFKELLSHNGFKTSHSNGYMLVFTDRKIRAPYLRRGLVRAEKF